MKPLTEEQKIASEIEHKERIAAHVKELVKNWPPMTQGQIDRVSILLRGDVETKPLPPAAADIERQRIENERLQAMESAQALAASLVACDVCDLPPEAHTRQKMYGSGYHDWEPGRADKILHK